MASQNISHMPFVATGVESVTGTLKVTPFPGRKAAYFTAALESSAAADANAASETSVIDNGDGSWTISCWKATAAGTTTLIAATAAVNVRWLAIGA